MNLKFCIFIICNLSGFLVWAGSDYIDDFYDDEIEKSPPSTMTPITEKTVKIITSNTDLNCTIVENVRIMETNSSTYILSGNEMFLLNITASGKQLQFLGFLNGMNDLVLDIQAFIWQNNIIFVAATATKYYVYNKNNYENHHPILIQKIPVYGRHRKLILFEKGKNLYSIIGSKFDGATESSMIRLFQWRGSLFSQLISKTFPFIDDIFYCKSDTETLIFFVQNDNPIMVVQVYRIENDILKHQQNIHFLMGPIHVYGFQGTCYILGHQINKVVSYEWQGNKFQKFHDHNDLLNVTHLSSAQGLIVLQEENNVYAVNRPDLLFDNRLSYSTANLSQLSIINSNNQIYVVLFFISSKCMKVEFFEVQFEGTLKAANLPDCKTKLKTILDHRQILLDDIKSKLPKVLLKNETHKILGTFQSTKPIKIEKGKIHKIKVNGTLKLTPNDLRNEIISLNKSLAQLKEYSGRTKREIRNVNELLTKINTLNVTNLKLSNDPFKNVLLKSINMFLNRSISTKSLEAKEIVDRSGTEIATNQTILGDPKPPVDLTFDSIPILRDLKAKRINGIEWNIFYKTLYLKGKRTTISGNLIVKSNLIGKNLKAKQINGLLVDDFMTTSTDQIVRSSIFVPNFFAVNVFANKVNNINFDTNHLATVKQNNVIESPVKILKCNIIGNLSLSDDKNQMLGRHIVGTKLEDLSQIYNGKVIIKGSLKVHNLILDKKETKIMVTNKTCDLNVVENYWMKSVDQKFGEVEFAAPIETPQIITKSINQHPADKFLLVNENPKLPLSLIMKTAKVYGNVFTDEKKPSKIQEIHSSYVKRNSVETISGRKIFKGTLIVDDFSCILMDYPSVSSLYLRSTVQEFIFPSEKQFDQLTVIGDVVIIGSDIEIYNLNGRDLMDFKNHVVKLDGPTHLQYATFKNLKVKNVTIGSIGKIPANEFIELFESSVGGEGAIKNVHVDGDVFFTGNLIVDTVNDINLNQYLNSIVTIETGGIVRGVKHFAKGLKSESIHSETIGPIQVQYWYENALRKSADQTITGAWKFNSLKANHIETSMINGVWTNQLIDTTAKFIKIKSDFSFGSAEIQGSLYGQMPCDVNSIEAYLQQLSNKKSWKSIQINGKAEWPTEAKSHLNLLLQNAVVNGIDQVISGEVIFAAESHIKRLSTKGLINNLNILAMHNDALTKSSQFQLVTGKKKFPNPISIRNVITEFDLQFPIINEINIVILNGSIFRLIEGNVITGKKTFATTLLIGHLTVKGSIHGIDPTDVVCVNNTKPIPPVHFLDTMKLNNNLEILGNLNSMSFKYFIKNRIRKTGKIQDIQGLLTFQHLVIDGNARIPSINKIQPKDIVNQKSDSLQEITGHKEIIGNFRLEGPAVISNVNDRNLVQAFTKSMLTNQNEKISRLEPVNTVTLEKGLNINKQINGIDMNVLKSWTPPTLTDLASLWEQTKTSIADVQTLSSQKAKDQKKTVLYLDFASNLEILSENYPKEFTFLVDTHISGEECGVDHRCICPAQYGVRLTSTYKIYVNRRDPFRKTILIIGHNCSLAIETSFIDSCTPEKRSLRSAIIWKYSTWPEQTMVVDEPVYNVKLLELDSITLLLINRKNGTVTVSLLNPQTKNWDCLTPIHRSSTKIEVLNWEYYHILAVFSPASHDNAHGVVEFYYFKDLAFVPFQSISGDYDLCASLHVDQVFMVFLGKMNTRTVTIFKADYIQQYFRRFVLLQRLEFDSTVVSFVPFSIDDASFIATVTSNGYFYLHKYNYIEGWVTSTYGYFKDIEAIVPFHYYNKTYLFVSAKNTATAMTVYHKVTY